MTLPQFKKIVPLKPKQFFTALEKIDFTLSRVRPTADIIAFVSPESEAGPQVDEDKVAEIKNVVKLLSAVLKELS